MKNNLRKHAALWVIALVFLATLYNILPSLIYFSKPLDKPLDPHKARHFVTYQIAQLSDKRALQINWIKALCSNLKLGQVEINELKDQPQLIKLRFKNGQCKQKFEEYFPAAVHLSSKLLADPRLIPNSHEVELEVALQPYWSKSLQEQAHVDYIPVYQENKLSPAFIELSRSWIAQTLFCLQNDPSFKGPIDLQRLMSMTPSQWPLSAINSTCELLSKDGFEFGTSTAYTQRKVNFLLQGSSNPAQDLKILTTSWEQYTEYVRQNASKENEADSQQLKKLSNSLSWLKSLPSSLLKTSQLYTYQQFQDTSKQYTPDAWYTPPFKHPLIEKMRLNLLTQAIEFSLYPELQSFLQSRASDKASARHLEALHSKLYEMMAYLEQQALGKSALTSSGFELKLPTSEYQRYLVWDVAALAQVDEEQLLRLLELWKPQHPCLSPTELKVFTYEQYKNSQKEIQDTLFCLIVDSKGQHKLTGLSTCEMPTILFKGFELLSQMAGQGDQKESFEKDIQRLLALLASCGYEFSGLDTLENSEFKGSAQLCQTSHLLAFESIKPYGWHFLGDSSKALLPITSYSAWLKRVNQLDDESHKELVQWHEDWRVANSNMNPVRQALAVKPPISLLWNNIKLSIRKTFRGDASKSLKWGLDLSGGKTVRLALYDAQSQQVQDPHQLVQARNELVQRVNRMGLSEVAARIEGDYLVLDFPSSQNYSSHELIQASSMTFHLVNERFCHPQSPHAQDAYEFLQKVWTQASVLQKTDINSLNEIGAKLLLESEKSTGSDAIKRLIAAGLKIDSAQAQASNALIDDCSMLVPVKADSKQASKVSLPLLIVFRNWALKGSDLSTIKSDYDPQHGHVLSFSVKDFAKDGSKPQEAFWNWTSRYCEENLAASSLQSFTGGRGWRMAVLLNEQVVSQAALNSALRDQAMIYGQFSQRDVSRLAADLQAGSLSFTPKILSEENISPELGQQDRHQGMIASLIALLSVIACMCGYYRFGGLIAAVAVTFNLLILWAILQNLGAALTLPGIAGIVLTVGMAVDANVLVFERIREELQSNRSLIDSIKAGYERAFSAIVDSNLTTILAALILVQFDSGPIKGFAMTLIIGIASSMFTALFVTRTFFEKWAVYTKCKTLRMNDWIGRPNIAFMKYSRLFIISGLVFGLVGIGLLATQRHQIFGMDFVGGYAFTLELEDTKFTKESIATCLNSIGIAQEAYNIRQLGTGGKWRVFLSRSLNNPGSVFEKMGEDQERLNWLKHNIKGGLSLDEQSLQKLESTWSAISGQLSQTMRTQAIIGVLLALAGILVYLAVRFEWTFALAGIISLSFDVFVSLAAISWLRLLGFPMQIDLQAIGAIMTIVGYALNDKIIVFDRIREQRGSQKIDRGLVQNSLRSTLSRTLMTSCTTLLVLLVLDIMGGSNLISFSMIMTVGVVVGTLSSLFVAPAILLRLLGNA